MKYICTFIILLFTFTLSAQTFQYPLGYKVILSPNGIMTITKSETSNNGGTKRVKVSGKIVNGKREGEWTGTITLNLYDEGNGQFVSGTETITKTYRVGKLNGAYKYSSNLNNKDGRYSFLDKKWIYGKRLTTFVYKASGWFANNLISGKWDIDKPQYPMTKGTFQFDNDGNAVGNWNIYIDNVLYNLVFEKGILKNKSGTSSHTYSITSEQIDNFITNKSNHDFKEVRLDDFIFEIEPMAYGGNAFNWIFRNIPTNASDEDIKIPTYWLVDYDELSNLSEFASEKDREKFEYDRNLRKQDAADNKLAEAANKCEIYLLEAMKDFWYDAAPHYVEHQYCLKLHRQYPKLKNHKFRYGSSYYNNTWINRYKSVLNEYDTEYTKEWERFQKELIAQLEDFDITDDEKVRYVSNPKNIYKHTGQSMTYTNSSTKILYGVKTETLKKKPIIYPELTEEDIAFFICNHLFYNPRYNTTTHKYKINRIINGRIVEINDIQKVYSATKEEIQQWVYNLKVKGKSYYNIEKSFSDETGAYYKTVTLKDIYDKSYDKRWFKKIRAKMNIER